MFVLIPIITFTSSVIFVTNLSILLGLGWCSGRELLCSVILVVDDRSYNELDMMVAPGNIVKLHIPASDDYKPLLTDDPRPAQPSQSEK